MRACGGGRNHRKGRGCPDNKQHATDEEGESDDLYRKGDFFARVVHVRDRRIELLLSVWKTDVLPLN